MGRFRSQGPLTSVQPGKPIQWWTAYGHVDPGIAIQNPNIVDDPITQLRLDVVSRSVQVDDGGFTAFVVFSNPGPSAVTHNVNLEDWQ
jgi:hypothetical protein